MSRRNFYRQLHVQPDAPLEVIRAAYRALIALHHPDAGGNHEVATQINEAWAVLSDPALRAAYDIKRAARQDVMKARTSASSDKRSAATAERTARTPAADADRAPPGFCAFCHAPVHATAVRCAHCAAPLTRVKPLTSPSTSDRADERRRVPRMSRADWGVLHITPHSDGIDVRMRNLSLDGVSVFCGQAMSLGQRVRIVAAAFDAVADVLACQRHGDVFVIHAQFVTAHFAAKAGSFVHEYR